MRPIDPRLIKSVPAVRTLLATLATLNVAGVVLIVAQATLLADLVVAIFQRHESGSELTARLLWLAAVGVGRAAVASAQEWLAAHASVRIRTQLRSRVLAAVVRLGPHGVSRQPSGRLVTAAGPGLESLDGYLTRAVPAYVAVGVVPAVVLGRIGLADWQSGLLLLVVLPLIPLFMWLVGVMTKRHMDRQYALLSKLSGHFLDLVQGLTTLKVYGQAGRQVQTVRRATESYRKHTMSTLRAAFLSGLVLDLISTLSVAVVAVDVGLRLKFGHLDLSTALLVLFLAPELFAPLRAVGMQHHAAVEGSTAAAAALDVIADAEAAEQAHRPGTAPVAGTTGRIDLHELRLTYPGRSEAALDGFDLLLLPGQIVAMQGRSGAGKTTVLSCLLDFERPDSGSITVGTPDGSAALASLAATSWREHVAWVPQRPELTQRTVAAEVALGDPGAPAERVAAAIEVCHAPHGDTRLGEGGSAVSAGQRRRVAMARALLRVQREIDAGSVPLLLLDEPTEDLDARTEQVIASVISSLAGKATVLFASHSDALAAVADRLVVVSGGRVVDDIGQVPVRVPAPAGGPVLDVNGHPTPVPRSRARIGDVLGLRGIAKRLTVAGALSGATGIAGLALTATSIWLICRASEMPNVQALAIAVVGVRTFALARALLRYAERLVSHDSALRLLAQVRARVFAALEPLVPAGLGDIRRGDLLRRFVNDVDGVQEGLVRAIVPFIGAAITSAGAVLLAALLAPWAGVALAIALLLGLLLAPWLSHAVAGPGERLTELAGSRDASATALIDGLAELTAYGAQDRALAEIAELDAAIAQENRRPALGAALGAAVTGVASAAALPAVLAAGAAATSANALAAVSVGTLAACVMAGFDALTTVPTAFAAWSRFRGGFERVAELLASPAPVPEPAVPATVPAGATGLRATGLDLAPAPSAPVILRDADLQLRPGQRVAIIGPSGCGKSTLMTAAMRLIPTSGGELELSRGRESVRLSELRAGDVPPLLAGSLQGDHVFDASLRDNLRVVRPEATDDELDVVARRAGLREFVAGLPDGWNTKAGPDGAALSGGQRQRLLLARALLADPDVLVLDEPTAHLDAQSEQEVLADLLDATRGRTLLMSTHRRLSPGQVDHVVRIDEGRLRDEGEPADDEPLVRA